MGILSWIVFGLLAGALAKFLMPGKDPGGCLITMILGIVGAIVGGFLAGLIGAPGVDRFDFRSLLVAILGSIVVLAIYRRFTKP